MTKKHYSTSRWHDPDDAPLITRAMLNRAASSAPTRSSGALGHCACVVPRSKLLIELTARHSVPRPTKNGNGPSVEDQLRPSLNAGRV